MKAFFIADKLLFYIMAVLFYMFVSRIMIDNITNC